MDFSVKVIKLCDNIKGHHIIATADHAGEKLNGRVRSCLRLI